jgi:hypothetical protein
MRTEFRYGIGVSKYAALSTIVGGDSGANKYNNVRC